MIPLAALVVALAGIAARRARARRRRGTRGRYRMIVALRPLAEKEPCP